MGLTLSNQKKKHFIGFAESVVNALWGLYTGRSLVDKFVSYLCTLYEPGPSMIAFQQDTYTMAMLGQFVLSVLAQSELAFEAGKTGCPCCGDSSLLPLYKKLAMLSGQLNDPKKYIMERLLSW